MTPSEASQEARLRLAELLIRLRDARRGADGPWFDLSMGTLESGQLEAALGVADQALQFADGRLRAQPGPVG